MTTSASSQRLFSSAALLLALAGFAVFGAPAPPESWASPAPGASLTAGAPWAQGASWAAGPPRGPAGAGPATEQGADSLDRIDRERLLLDLSILSHDSMEGRRAGTEGIERARRFLIPALEARGLTPVEGRRSQDFRASGGGGVDGVNLFGLVEGTEFPDRYLVISAHYDHLGIRGGEIYNGADDNASGTAALLSLAEHFSRNPPRHSLLFVAFDAEEIGLQGARAFVGDPPVPLESVVMNVNLDMVSRSDRNELYAAGTYHYPFLVPLVEEVAADARVTLLMGHDSPGLPPGDDWTFASDHGPFHEAGIPFLYFGVEDHDGYHDPSDTFENITPDFYVNAVETVLSFIGVVDEAAPVAFGAGAAQGR